MALVPAICTQCGANIETDKQKKAAVCPFCGTAYIVEHAINNFYSQTENEIDKFDGLCRKLDAFKRIGERKKCLSIVQEMVEEFPDKYESWYYKAETISDNFTKRLDDSAEFINIRLIDDCIIALQRLGCDNKEYLDRCVKYQEKLISEKKAYADSLLKFVNEESKSGLYFKHGSSCFGLEMHGEELYYVSIGRGRKTLNKVSIMINEFDGQSIQFQNEDGEVIKYWTNYTLNEYNIVSINVSEVEAFYSGGNVKWYTDKELYNRKEDERSFLRKIFDYIDSF